MQVTIAPFVPRAAAQAAAPPPAPSVCPLCDGLKVVPIPQHLWPKGVFQPVRPCECLRAQILAEELDTACPGLSRIDPHPESPLDQLLGASAAIRGSLPDFQQHLSRILRDANAARAGTRTITDQDLIDAQFTMSRKDADLPADLFMPPSLLILQLGCCSPKHKYLRSVVGQAVSRRAHAGRATWIVDTEIIKSGHPAWSDQLARVLGAGQWSIVDLDPQPAASTAQEPGPVPAQVAAPAEAPARTEGLPIDPEILEMAIRNGWTHHAQTNKGIRTLCHKHPDTGPDLSIWRVMEGALKGKLRYKCQLPKCGASGDPARLPPSQKIRA